MNLTLVAIVLVLLALAALVLAILARKASWPTAPRADVPPDVRTEVDHLVAAGRHVEAIKAVRAHTSWGLVDAKNYVDGVRRGDTQPPRPGAPTDLSPQIRLQVEELAARGELVEAVKLVRQQTSLGLGAATEFVRGLRHS